MPTNPTYNFLIMTFFTFLISILAALTNFPLYIFLFLFLFFFFKKFVKDNSNIIPKEDSSSVFSTVIKVFLLWLPFALILVPGVSLTLLIDRGLDFGIKNLDSLVQDKINVSTVLEEVFEDYYWLDPRRIFGKKVTRVAKEVTQIISKPTLPKVIVRTLRNALDLLSLYFMVYLTFILFKSFGYIFLRFQIYRGYNFFFTLNPDSQFYNDSPRVFENNPSTDVEIRLTSSDFFSRRDLDPFIHPPSLSLPQPFSSFIARIWWKTWFMNRSSKSNKPSVGFKVAEGRYLFKIEVPSDYEVIFSHKNLVGFSDSIKLGTIISFHLVSLGLLGKIFYHSARGPGYLIFETSGKPYATTDGFDQISFPPHLLVGWAKDSSFKIDGSKKFLDIFFSSPNFEQVPERSKSFIIFDGDDQKNQDSNALWKVIKQIYYPG